MTVDNFVRPRIWVRAKSIVEQMQSWFQSINDTPKRQSRDGRTNNERLFDSGVFAAAELVRRLTNDEELALAVHEACVFRQREHQREEARK